MAFLPGKFARFKAPTTISGPFRWNLSMRRERLDTTNFESTAVGENVFSEGETGVMDTTFSVEMYMTDANYTTFYPGTFTTCDLLFRKDTELGYAVADADVLEFQPNTSVRDRGMATVQLQSNGVVGYL